MIDGIQEMTAFKTSADIETDESEIVRRIIRGDGSGFEFLVARYGKRMLAATRRITGNEADAHDCLQEALPKCLNNVERLEARSGLGTWLHRIVVNVSLIRLGSRNRSREDSLDALLSQFDEHGLRGEEAPHSNTMEIEQLYEQGQTQAAVSAAVDRLRRTTARS